MKYYPAILLTRQELYAAGVPEIRFENGYIHDRTVLQGIEDYCGRPLVSVREFTRGTDEIAAIIADGYIQYNRLTGKRSVVLTGGYDTLKVVLTDILHERADEDPYDVFCSYAYQTDINIQLELQNWVRNEYRP